MNNMDTVFATANDADTEFDTMFDQDDNLVDTVNGVNEAGDPLTGVEFDELHQEDDKDNATDPTANAPETPIVDDATVEGEDNKASDADAAYKDTEDDYADDIEVKEAPKADAADIEATIDKVAEDADVDVDTDDTTDVDDIEDEINSEVEACKEADEVVDTDVSKVDAQDVDDDDNLIDTAAGDASAANKQDDKLTYDPSDEELIDMTISGTV